MDLPPAAAPLLALPPSRFTAERDALAKALAERRDPAAPAVRKLRRPVGLAWVLNRLAQERPRELEALVAAGDRLRAGQRRAVAGAGAGELRAAEDDLRGRARALRSEAERILSEEGKAPSPTALARIELLLRVAAPVPGPTRDSLRRGVLLREPEAAPGELGGFAVIPGGRSEAAAPAAAARPRRAERSGRARANAVQARAEERAARASEARRRREQERAAAAARRAAEAARARAEREERAAAAAAARAEDARRRAEAARAEADRLAARARELEGTP